MCSTVQSSAVADILPPLVFAEDLKERHRRRCEKAIKTIRPPRKRECESCIASKVKCDLVLPSCSFTCYRIHYFGTDTAQVLAALNDT